MKKTLLFFASLFTCYLSTFGQTPTRFTDVNPGIGHSYPEIWFELGNYIYFEATGESGDLGFYRTDGITTDYVDAIALGTGQNYPRINEYVELGGEVLFVGAKENTGSELYKVNQNGIVGLVADIKKGPSSSGIWNLVKAGSFVCFNAKGNDDQSYTFAYNGSKIDTVLLTFSNTQMINVNDRIYLMADTSNDMKDNRELFYYDGQHVKKGGFNEDKSGKHSHFGFVTNLYNTSDNKVYLFGSEDVSSNYKLYLLKNDTLYNLPIPGYANGIGIETIGVVDDMLFFSQYNTATFVATSKGVEVVSNTIAANYSFSRNNYIRLGDKVYFQGWANSNLGAELYAYDITKKSAFLVKDFRPGSNSGEPRYFTLYNGDLYFSAMVYNDMVLVKYNGTTFTYFGEEEYNYGTFLTELVAFKSGLYFTDYYPRENYGYEIYSIDRHNIVTSVDHKLSLPDDTQIEVYPNPASDILHLKSPFSNWIIINNIGETILEGEGTEIPVSALPQGLYLLKNGSRNIKIVKD